MIPAEELVARFPDVRIDLDSRAWFEGLLEHRLLVNRCTDCGRWHHPPLPRCPGCWSSAVTATEVAGRGTVFSVVGFPGAGDGDAVALVVVDLDEQDGLRLTTAWAGDPAEARIGRRVVAVWPGSGASPFPAFGPAPDEECDTP